MSPFPEERTTGRVRPYAPHDRAAVLRIGAETAFFGEPVERFLDDRMLFCDAVYRYYTDLEPEHAWVAASGERVVGFIVGAVDSRAQARAFRRQILPALVLRSLLGRYRLGGKTVRYAFSALLAALRGEYPRVDLDRYPAHLHINLLPAARGLGLGRRLMEAYLSQLRELGTAGVHLRTSSMNQAAVVLYDRMGFHLLDSRPTRLWSWLVDHPTANLCYGLYLRQPGWAP